jgi:membrane protease YdiL (CAAX protease family)
MDTAAASSGASGVPRRIAPLWHTAVLILAILLLSVASSGRQHLVTNSRTRVLQYLLTLTWEWLLFVYCVWGARKSGTGLRELVGGRWHEIEDVLIDLLTAAGFWVAAMIALSLAARLLHLAGGNQLDDVQRQIGSLVPRSAREVVLWILLSLTAGICEEVVFRGYLQRQLAALTRNVWAGIVVSGFIFGCAHGYEGVRRMMLVGIYGMMFGLLAHFRRSLRPGMIAHAFHDGVTGLALRFFLK